MAKRILCAIDLHHQNHDKVLLQAEKLSKLENAPLDVLTVIPNYQMTLVSSFFDENFQAEAVKETQKKLTDRVSEILGKGKNKDIRHIVAVGSAYEEILLAAKQAESDLIVIGAHKPGLREFLLGRNATLIARHSPCSVYIVRDETD